MLVHELHEWGHLGLSLAPVISLFRCDLWARIADFVCTVLFFKAWRAHETPLHLAVVPRLVRHSQLLLALPVLQSKAVLVTRKRRRRLRGVVIANIEDGLHNA